MAECFLQLLRRVQMFWKRTEDGRVLFAMIKKSANVLEEDGRLQSAFCND